MRFTRSVDERVQPMGVPLIGHERFLEYFMQDCAIDEGRGDVGGGFDAVLQHGAAGAGEGVGYDGRG